MTLPAGQLTLDVPDVTVDPLADLDFAHAAQVLAAQADFRPVSAPRCGCELGPVLFADDDEDHPRCLFCGRAP